MTIRETSPAGDGLESRGSSAKALTGIGGVDEVTDCVSQIGCQSPVMWRDGSVY